MPMVLVEYPAGQLLAAQKTVLAEELTRVLLDIEGGGDTHYGRAGSLVRFRESAREDWYVGGTNGDTYTGGRSLFLVEIFVPEGLLDEARKSQAHKAVNDAVGAVIAASGDETRYVWVQIFEWPDGSLGTAGQTANLFGIAKRAGHSAAHPVLEFPRAYFEAKNRMYGAHGFPAGTPGLAPNRY